MRSSRPSSLHRLGLQPLRSHSTLGYVAPVQFEQRMSSVAARRLSVPISLREVANDACTRPPSRSLWCGSSRSVSGSPSSANKRPRGSFSSVRDLVRKIDSYVIHCDTSQRPFTSNATGDSSLDKIQRLL